MIYLNEFDAGAAQWLRELVDMGELPDAWIDDRDCRDVRAGDIGDATQCHWFAGIGGWPLAFALAGWDTARHVWSASLPCQPFSAAGKGAGADDERHLWPAFHALVAQCRPAVLVGEQVASADGREWLAAVFADLEDMGYAVAGADLCAASVGAPHIRQRLFWCGVLDGVDGGVAHNSRQGLARRAQQPAREKRKATERSGDVGWLANHETRRRGKVEQVAGRGDEGVRTQGGERPGDGSCPDWSAVEYVPCLDNKIRPIPEAQSGVQPLVDGIPAGMVPGRDPGIENATQEASAMRLRGYGNSIVPALAAEFLMSVEDCLR